MTQSYPPAPNITLKAAVSNREFRYNAPGTTSLLLCLTQETQPQAEAIEEMARRRWPLASDLLVVYVIDLRKVPFMLKGIAESVMDNEYKKSLDGLPEGCDPHDYVIITPDWKGETAKAFDLDANKSDLTLVILTKDGRLAGTLHGASTDEVEAAIEAAINA